jgi:hypothetical protein
MFACQDAQQRGLADPVRTDESDPRPLRNAPSEPDKDIDSAERLPDIVKG